MSELREAHRYSDKTTAKDVVNVGDVVLVHDDSQPRGFWKLACVNKLVTGRDGLVRGAILRVGSSEGRVSTLQRPLQRLCPLEVSSMTSEVRSDTSLEGEQAKDVDQGEPTRPRRATAIQDRMLASATQEQENDWTD